MSKKDPRPMTFVSMSDVRAALATRPINVEGRKIETVEDMRTLSHSGWYHLARAVQSTLASRKDGTA